MSRVLPILFNTEMVQAILEGRKTVTRRICKDANEFTVPDMSFFDDKKRTYAVHNYADAEHTDKLSVAERTCPICPGDILYVRETWCKSPFTDNYIYRADGERELFSQSYDSEIMDDTVWTWKPSIHMPKEAARIFLKVTGVRAEQLRDITDAGAYKEGAGDKDVIYQTGARVLEFARLWDSTIKKSDMEKYGWNANPWVWVIEFEQCEKPEEWK